MNLESTLRWESDLYKGEDPVSPNVRSFMSITQVDCELHDMQGPESFMFDFFNINMYIKYISLNVLSECSGHR